MLDPPFQLERDLRQTRRIALKFIQRDQQTLVFANNRLAPEIMVTYLEGRSRAWAARSRDRARLSRRIS
jgi:hypothetical protein